MCWLTTAPETGDAVVAMRKIDCERDMSYLKMPNVARGQKSYARVAIQRRAQLELDQRVKTGGDEAVARQEVSIPAAHYLYTFAHLMEHDIESNEALQ